VTDKKQIQDKWSPIVKAWFPDGVDDPNLSLLKVIPKECYYWDSETGKMVQFAKMIVAAVAGTPKIAESAEGTLKL
jgi:general stress protein 26